MAVNAGTIYSEVRVELDKLKGDLNKVETRFNRFGKQNAAQSTKIKKSWKDSFKQINLAGVAAFAGLSLIVKNTIKTFANFQQSIANVKSVAGGTAEEFSQIEEAARNAGETTRFTASQAADALYALASAGLDASESASALDGVLQLAGATQADLASTSATVTATLSQYELAAEDATRVSNVFAAAIGNSQANMEKLSIAFRQVGPVAAGLGVSLEETTGALQALFDAGFKGEQAGTALRNALGSLANETDPVVQKLNALGISFEEVNPVTNDFASVIGRLSEAGLEAGEIINVFGREMGPQLLTLVKTGEQGIRDYTDAVSETNAAAEAYAIQNDTLAGSFDALKSTVESAKIGLVNEFEPALRAIVDGLRSVIKWLGDLPGPAKIFFGVLLGGIPVVIGLTAVMGALAGVIGTVAGPITLVVAGVAALTAGITAIARAVRRSRLEDIAETFGDLSEELEISNERMLELAKAAKRLGAEGDEAVGDVISRLHELQTELGLSNEKMDDLIKLARRMGATDEDIDNVIATIHELNTEFELTDKEIKRITRALQTGDVAGNMQNAAEHTRDIADFMGITQEAVLKIGVMSGEITDEYRDQLQKLLDINQAEKNRLTVQDLQAEKLEMLRKQEEIESAKKIAAIENEAERQREVSKARKQAEQNLQSEIRISQTLRDSGIISQQEALEREISARKQLAEVLASLGYTGILEKQKIWNEVLGEFEEKVSAGNITLNEQREMIAALEEALSGLNETEKEAGETVSSYREKLADLLADEREQITLARGRALAEVEAAEAAGMSADAADDARDAINEYYDALVKLHDEQKDGKQSALEWSEEQKKILSDLNKYVGTTLAAFSKIAGSLGELAQASAQKQIDEIDRVLEAQIDAYDQELQAALESAGVAEETKLESLNRQLQEAIAAGDQETAEELQDQITRTEIKQKFEKKKTQAEVEAEREKARIEYEANLSSWRAGLAMAVADAARAIIQCFTQLGPIAGAIAAVGVGVTTGVQIAAMSQAKPQPPKFARGGFVVPDRPGYEAGGIVIPSGSSGREITVAENNAPEMMMNAGMEGREFMNQFADILSDRIGRSGGSMTLQMYIDGRKLAETNARYYRNGIVRLEV